MPENKTEELNRRKRTVANRDMDTIIITADNDKDIYSSKVFDFSEFVETSTNGSAIKLRNLKKYGITEEMIISTYKEMSGSIETEETAVSELESIFRRLATYISLQPNGIVIDLHTGEIDPEASFAQAVSVGIYSEDSVILSTDDFIMEQLENIKKYDPTFTENMAEEYLYLLNNFDSDYISKEEVKKDIDDFLKKDVSELDFSDNLKQFIQNKKDLIANSEYETRMELFEITKLEIDIERAAGTPAVNVLISKREKFYADHPKYVGTVPVRKKDGSINLAEVERYEDFKEAYQIQFITSQIDEFKKIPNGDINKLSEQSKRNIIMGIVSGLKYNRRQSPEFQEIVKECSIILEKICPGLDLSQKNTKEMKMLLADFAKKEMGFRDTPEELNFTNLSDFAFRQVEATMEDFIINDKEVYRNGDIFDGVNVLKNKLYDSSIRNYFVDSKIQFSEVDEKKYDKAYKIFTINAWIDSKDKALDLRYQSLKTFIEEYKSWPPTDFIVNKIENLEKQLSEFEENFPDVVERVNSNQEESEKVFSKYRKHLVNAGLTKFYTRDILNENDGKSYKSLKPEDKKAYIRNVLVGFKFINANPNASLSKVILRRLELMNNDDRTFIEINDDGSYTLNEEAIFEEYKSMSKYEYKDYQELLNSAQQREDEYILKKLSEYTFLKEEDFLKLDNPQDLDASIAQIEDIRIKSNTTRIQKRAEEELSIARDLEQVANDSKKTINESPYEKDVHLFEISKLSILLEESKGTSSYNIILSKIEEFYKRRPVYRGKNIPILNQDGTINKNEYDKMDEYSEAYQKIAILENLDSVKGMKQEDVLNMSEAQKRNAIVCALAGLKYQQSDNKETQAISKQSIKIIEKLYPGIDTKSEEKMTEFLKNKINIGINFDSVKLEDLIKISSLQLKENIETFIIDESESYVKKQIKFSEMDFDIDVKKKIEKNTQDKSKATQVDSSVPIGEDLVANMFENGQVEVGQINVATKNNAREIKAEDQTENDIGTGAVQSEFRGADLSAAQINISGIDDLKNKKDDKKISLIGRIKQAFNAVKSFISEHISRKEKVELLETGNATAEMKKTLDFNSSISAGLSLQEQQEYSKKQQMQALTNEGKATVEQEERL